MKTALTWTTIAGIVVCCLAVGCDAPPGPPRTADGKIVKFLAVPPGEQGELAAATALEVARVNYNYRLEVLRNYYETTVGNMDKRLWTGRELENLARTQAFRWENLPEVISPTGEALADADERLLVEYVIAARKQYTEAVDELAELYESKDQTFKAALVRNMQSRFDPVRTYMYFLAAEIPGPDLQPTEMISGADQIYSEALKLFNDGKGILFTFLTTDYDKQRQALALFRKLIREHPNSTKIALSAYYIAEIYKEYFNENIRAVHWYERAWQWDPNIIEPARFQAATVHDLRLCNYAEAVRCYRLSIKHDPPRLLNYDTALRRIKELTGEGK
jgi:tetratricopeptide (TPR) repeat protein